MRNLTQYPITPEEKLHALEWAVGQAQVTADQRGVGDVTVAALQALRQELDPEKAGG